MEDKAKTLLKTYLIQVSLKNKLDVALQDFLKEVKFLENFKKIDEIPFSSDRKYSACIYDDITLVLGAPEILLDKDNEVFKTVEKFTKESYRVVVFGTIEGRYKKSDQDIKKKFHTLSVIAIDDPIREETKKTLDELTREKIQHRIISGDSLNTVVAVARKIDKDYPISAITGEDLSELKGKRLEKAILEHTIFARIKPQQKLEIITTLKKNNLFTVMIGDGANDVLALKASDLSVAMNGGSNMAKNVSDVVLLNNSFATLPLLLNQGRKIITNIQTIANMYLIKNVSSIAAILMLGFIGFRFPFDPRHVQLSGFLVIGIPSVVLAFEQHSFSTTDHGFIRRLVLFSGFIGLANAIVSSSLFTYYGFTNAIPLYSRSILLTSTIFLGIGNIIVIYLQHYSLKQILRRKLVIGLLLSILFLFMICLILSPVRSFFGIVDIRSIDILITFFISILGTLLVVFSLKKMKLLKTFSAID